MNRRKAVTKAIEFAEKVIDISLAEDRQHLEATLREAKLWLSGDSTDERCMEAAENIERTAIMKSVWDNVIPDGLDEDSAELFVEAAMMVSQSCYIAGGCQTFDESCDEMIESLRNDMKKIHLYFVGKSLRVIGGA